MIILRVMIHMAGTLVFLAAMADGWALATGRVTAARRPLYYYRGFVKTLLLAIYLDYVFREVWGANGLPDGLTSFGTVMVFFLIGLEWVLTWVVDRYEYTQVLKAEANRLTELLP